MAGISKKIKDFLKNKNEYDEDEYDEYDEYEDEDEEYEEEEEYVSERDIMSSKPQSTKNTSTGKLIGMPGGTQMKVVIVEPKKYEDANIIADNLKQKRAVVVNLEGLAQEIEIKKQIFYFMSGAVYVLGGSIQQISKAIFILAPSNVDIDQNMKKELESKAFFPWQK